MDGMVLWEDAKHICFLGLPHPSPFPDVMGRHDDRYMKAGVFEFFSMGGTLLGRTSVSVNHFGKQLIGQKWGDRKCVDVFLENGKLMGRFEDLREEVK